MRIKQETALAAVLLALLLPGYSVAAEGAIMPKATDKALAIPAIWANADAPAPPKTPRIDWEAWQRNADLSALEEAWAKSSEHMEGRPVPMRKIPWADRPRADAPRISMETAIGRFRAPSLSVDQEVWWSFEQWPVDDPGKMELWGYGGLPGEPGYAQVLLDHNYQTGRLLASLPAGSLVFLDMPWGSYAYRLVSSELAEDDGKTERFIDPFVVRRAGDETGSFIGDAVSPSRPGGWINNAGISNPKNDGELWFLTCWPLNAKHTDRRLVLRFECLDGPVLD